MKLNFIMLKKYFLSLAFVLVGLTSKAQTVLEYNVGGAATGADYISNGLNLDFNAITSCQTAVSAVFSSAGFSGAWVDGSFDYYVNGTLVGSGTGSATVDLSAYIPVQSVRIQKTNYNNWNTVSMKLNVTSNTGSLPSLPQAVSDVYYLQNSTASPLNAILTGTGTALKWYTSATGEGYSATAPVPSTATLGTTSYWVSQVDAGGCESVRKQINVHVNIPATHLNFDGADDYVEVAGIPNPTGSFTIEAWATLETKGFRTILSKISNGYHGFTFSYDFINDKMRASIGTGNSFATVQSLTAWNLNQWYHVALVYNATLGTMSYYQDGVMQGDASVLPSYAAATFKIGNDAWTEVWDGNIDEVRVWNVARTQVQLQENMNCELNNPTSQTGLVAYFQFNQGADGADNTALTTLADSSATAYTATLTNFALNGTVSNWLSGSSVVTGSTCSILSSNDFAFNFENVKVYPNPSSGIFQLQIQEEVQLEVYDLMGKMFLQKNVQAGAAFFDLSQYASGVYILKATNVFGDTIVSKIVKE